MLCNEVHIHVVCAPRISQKVNPLAAILVAFYIDIV